MLNGILRGTMALVARSMADQDWVNTLLYNYFVLNRPKTELMEMFKVNRARVEWLIRWFRREAGGFPAAVMVLLKVTPELFVVPKCEHQNGRYKCLYCGANLDEERIVRHLLLMHEKEIRELATKILEFALVS